MAKLRLVSRARKYGPIGPGGAISELEGEGRTDHSPSHKSSATGDLVRSEGRDALTVTFEREVVSFFVDAAELLGVPKSVAAIYGVCFSSADPLSFADIVARLAISMGSISQGVRILHNVGALKRVGSRNRRDYYAPEMELRKLASRFIEERLEKQLRSGTNRLNSIRGLLPVEKVASSSLSAPRDTISVTEASTLHARLNYLQSWHDQARGIIPLARSILTLT